jgi:hypothetical protein
MKSGDLYQIRRLAPEFKLFGQALWIEAWTQKTVCQRVSGRPIGQSLQGL